ncbi:MAG: response regulator [Deltaproteobacteria bacterium]|nr:response regulator [Deltaproteobacteria bacterium]
MTRTGPLVLLVEDEAHMRRFLRASLTAHGYRLVETATAAEAMRQAKAYNPDLVILDLGLPDRPGGEVIRALREWSAAPIVVISARGQEQDKIDALDGGADDYLTKPFGTGELLARLRVALRRAERVGQEAETTLSMGDVSIDFTKRVVTVSGREVHLTPIEYKLLAALGRNAGMVLTHRQLLEQVWGPTYVDQTQYLRVYMAQLRHKIEADPARPRHLVTEPGVGYRLRVDSDDASRGPIKET